jgi:16S rRNA (cytosine1402-N4)-methyltransferase
MEKKHDSVLMSEVLEALDIQPADVVVDGTLGGAGHFGRILSQLGAEGVLVGIDADREAIGRAQAVLDADARKKLPTVHIVHDNFRNLTSILSSLNIEAIDKVLFDLGWSGFQIASPRGFSFQNDEPLLMSYGEEGETAASIVNSSSEKELADIIFVYGEERFARSIAHAIVSARAKGRLLTTGALVEAILAGTPRAYHKGKTHPATKTFQALRIAVNDELGALKQGLASALEALRPGGRIAVISFHSIEDRIVKEILRFAVEEGLGTLVAKKPIVPSRTELLANRRARSAKLRVFERSTAYA